MSKPIGRPIRPIGKVKQSDPVTVRFDREHYAALQKLAKQHGQTVNQELKDIAIDWLLEWAPGLIEDDVEK